MSTDVAKRIPLVSYLHLEPTPHLVAQECTNCATSFTPVAIPTSGVLTSFTIVTFAAPGVPVPFVAGIVDCGGTSVRANVIGVTPDPEHVKLGMAVQLELTSLGLDDNGVEGVGFGFAPTA
jgi:uncharacterized protein